ncbi:DUF2478 domain-containing protein [Ochrobactrum sp. Kaboul]|nr:DUF2478 domain-containing protein [Ochrobactrum sp. Kaboul]
MSNPAQAALTRAVNRAIANGSPVVVNVPPRIAAGYRAFTGHVFTATQAAAYNAALDRFERSPNEANQNGAHNLFYSIALTGKEA